MRKGKKQNSSLNPRLYFIFKLSQNRNMSDRKSCYCAFCKSERKVYMKKNVSFVNMFAALSFSLIATYVIWQKFEPDGVYFFIMLLVIQEAFIQFRWRLNLVCEQCGFDPLVYRKNPALAAEKVRLHLERRNTDPRFMLSRPLNLPKVSRDKWEKESAKQKQELLVLEGLAKPQSATSGRIVSKSV